MYANVFKWYLFMQKNVYFVDLNTSAKGPKQISAAAQWRIDLDKILQEHKKKLSKENLDSQNKILLFREMFKSLYTQDEETGEWKKTPVRHLKRRQIITYLYACDFLKDKKTGIPPIITSSLANTFFSTEADTKALDLKVDTELYQHGETRLQKMFLSMWQPFYEPPRQKAPTQL